MAKADLSPNDSRHIVGRHVSLSTDETTILRKEPIRIKAMLYTGTTDADATTDVNLVGMPITAEVIGASIMIRDSDETLSWRIYDNECNEETDNTFRILWLRNTSGNRVLRISEVGADMQGQPYRLLVWWCDKL